jgi:MtN3 and saliva related transmembrane protein
MPKKYFESFMVVFATIEPIATIPQIIKIWGSHSTQGVSLLTWLFYALTSLVWLAYGISKKDKALIISGALWALSQTIVVLGLLIN